MKRTRNENKKYTPESDSDMAHLRMLVQEAFKIGISKGYDPSDIFYEISAEANTEFLMNMLV